MHRFSEAEKQPFLTLGLADQLFRSDQLIGCGNLVAFTELISRTFNEAAPVPLSLLALDVNNFSRVNSDMGHVHGDAALRWIGLVLTEESHTEVFRVGGDELVAILLGEDPAQRESLAQQIFDRLNNQAGQFGLQVPAAAVALIHYTGAEQVNPADVFLHISATTFDVKVNHSKGFHVYQAAALDTAQNLETLRWVASRLIERVVALGARLDESLYLAYTDPVTGLPNQRAAQSQLTTRLAQAGVANQPFSILLIDGDDLRKYNAISYAAGDEMILRLGAALREQLRPGDFLARWRVGDEFLVILPSTPAAQAIAVGERLCQAVQRAAQDWILPVTVSVGIAGYPEHGDQESQLLRQAEAANDRAKSQGKNRVASAG